MAEEAEVAPSSAPVSAAAAAVTRPPQLIPQRVVQLKGVGSGGRCPAREIHHVDVLYVGARVEVRQQLAERVRLDLRLEAGAVHHGCVGCFAKGCVLSCLRRARKEVEIDVDPIEAGCPARVARGGVRKKLFLSLSPRVPNVVQS